MRHAPVLFYLLETYLLSQRLGDGFLPAVLRLEDQFDNLADSALTAVNSGDVMRGAFYFHDGVGDGDGQAGALENGQIGRSSPT